jgi:hypothetical protein
MTIQRILMAALALSAGVASMMWAQTPSKLTARELFLAPPQPVTKAAPAKKAAAQKQAVAKKAASAGQQTAATKAPSRPAAPSTPPRPVQEIEREVPQVQLVSQSDDGDARFMNVSHQSAVPLALRYSILKYGADDEGIEVDPDMVFRSGDRIRLRIQVNDTGYLYIVTQGSSGNWRVLFPSAEHDDGSNKVTRGRSYDIPKRTRFVFDEQPGTEKLFLVLTRTPEYDLDRLIYQLDSPREAEPEPEPEAKPAAKPAPTLLAMNTMAVSDDLVGQLRNRLTARDLVFEKVNDDKPDKRSQRDPEKAVYVANPSRESSARLIVDIELKHR